MAPRLPGRIIRPDLSTRSMYSAVSIRDNKRSVSCFFSSFYSSMDLSRGGLRKMIKHVRTGLQTRPDFQSWDRSGGTALESRPHMFNSGSRLSFGCGPAALWSS